jgi:hypothetical protein
MLNIVSILIGLVTLVLGLVAFIPLLGWMNWLVIPIGIIEQRRPQPQHRADHHLRAPPQPRRRDHLTQEGPGVSTGPS